MKRIVKSHHPAAYSPFSKMLDGFFNGDLNHFVGTDGTNSVPKVNVTEFDDSFQIELAAPGLSKKDFSINLEKNRLSIRASKETSDEGKEGKLTRREFNYFNFERSFILPKTVNTNEIKAGYKNGILKITLLKREEDKEQPARNIEIA